MTDVLVSKIHNARSLLLVLFCVVSSSGYAEDASLVRQQLERDRASLAALQAKITSEETALATYARTKPDSTAIPAAKSPGRAAAKTATPEAGPNPDALISDTKDIMPAGEVIYPYFSYDIRLAASYGYDSNVNGLSNKILRFPPVDHRGSPFILLNPGLTLTRYSDEDTAVDLKYDLLKYYFEGQADSNRTTHTLTLDRTQTIGLGRLKLAGTGVIKLTDEEGRAAQLTLTPDWLQHWGTRSRWSTDFAFSFQLTDYHTPDNKPVIVISDPDSRSYNFGITQFYTLREEQPDSDRSDPGLKLGLTYNLFLIDTDGRDGDEFRHEVQVSLVGRLFSKNWETLHKFSVEAIYTHDFDQYWNRNSRAGIDAKAEVLAKLAKVTGGFYGDGFQFRRSDNTDDFRLTLAYNFDFGLPWKDKAGKLPRFPVQSAVATTYEFNRQDSNLLDRSKDDHIIRLGLISDF